MEKTKKKKLRHSWKGNTCTKCKLIREPTKKERLGILVHAFMYKYISTSWTFKRPECIEDS